MRDSSILQAHNQRLLSPSTSELHPRPASRCAACTGKHADPQSPQHPFTISSVHSAQYLLYPSICKRAPDIQRTHGKMR